MISSRMLLISSLLLAMCVALPSGDFRERRQTGGMEPADSCETPNREQSQCININDCSTLCYHSLRILSAYKCGSDETDIKVCCPQSSVGIELPRSCVTPDGKEGQCLLFSRCPSICKVNRNRLRSYKCGMQGMELKVCCPGNNTGDDTSFPDSSAGAMRPKRSTPVVERPSFLPQECGVRIVTTSRIAGGKESTPGAWPWMAAIFVKREEIRITACAGSLITSKHVITATHCLYDERGISIRPSSLYVRLGDHNLYSDNDDMNPIEFEVHYFNLHWLFNSLTRENDIAILKLWRHVTFGKDIAPICLPYDSLTFDDLTSRRAIVAGWGALEFGGPGSSVLMEGTFPVISQQECWDAYKCFLAVRDGFICTVTPNGSTDLSMGDSGGPLMLVGKENRIYLMGIVSLSMKNYLSGYPIVYTRVTEYLDWITWTITGMNERE